MPKKKSMSKPAPRIMPAAATVDVVLSMWYRKHGSKPKDDDVAQWCFRFRVINEVFYSAHDLGCGQAIG